MAEESDRLAAKRLKELTNDSILGWADEEEIAELISDAQIIPRTAARQVKRDFDILQGTSLQQRYALEDTIARQRAELASTQIQLLKVCEERDTLRTDLQLMESELKSRKRICIEMIEAREAAELRLLISRRPAHPVAVRFCAASNSSGASSDIYYTLNSASGATTITVNFNSTGTNVSQVEMFEYSFSGSSVSFDAGNNIVNATNTLRGGVSLAALTGTNDLLIQSIAMSNSGNVTAISGAYTTTDFGNPASGGAGFAAAANSVTGTAPTWTFSGNAFSAGSGIAISEGSTKPSIVVGGSLTSGGKIIVN